MSGIILESLLTCPALRLYEAGSHAYGCLPALLRMQQLQGTVATESGGAAACSVRSELRSVLRFNSTVAAAGANKCVEKGVFRPLPPIPKA